MTPEEQYQFRMTDNGGLLLYRRLYDETTYFIAVMLCLGLTAIDACPTQVMNGPTAVQFDDDPLGALQLSGGMEGYGYVTNNPAPGDKSSGVQLGNAFINRSTLAHCGV
jgi:hypothetical protein